MNESTDATAIFAPLWKRKWLILLVALLVAGGTYAYYKRKPSVYQLSTQLYLGAGSEEQALSTGANKALALNAANQVVLINSVISETVHKRLRAEHNAAASHGKVKAKGTEKSQFITITAEARTPRATALLANLTAQTYIAREHGTFTREIERAVAIARRQLRRVEGVQRASPGPGKGKGAGSNLGSVSSEIQAASLNSKVNQLEAQLSIKGVQQVAMAKPLAAVQLAPKPRQNAIFGFFLGLILASIGAYCLSRLDRRLRTLADVEAAVQTQILIALPQVRNPIVVRDGERVPSPSLLEPLRRLHTTLQLQGSQGQDRSRSPRSILFVSADAGDGKSSVIANLARVQRDAGERVAVIDADFRRPAQAGLLDVARPEGLAEVLEGRLALHEAMQRVGSAGPSPNGTTAGAAGVATVVGSRSVGVLSVLVSGGAVANPPALLARETMNELLGTVAEEHDYVLIDAPPPLEVSDVMPLLNAVDGIVIVVRIGHTREISAQRLMQLLMRTSTAPVLGTVANFVPRADIEKYGFSSVSTRRSGRRNLVRR